MAVDSARADAAIDAFRRGEIVIVTDDHDRENEGDLILAAVHATPEKLAFIIRHTSGIVCAPITTATAARLRLSPMVADNDAPLGTAFTVSVDFRAGLTTGISAEERCRTVRALANPKASAEDFVRPGHVFPLIARRGGVLTRSGHTEAAVDLCELAGLEPVGVICELTNDDGTVMRGLDIDRFAAANHLRVVSVDDLISLRQRRERLVKRLSEVPIETPAGPARAITYSTPWDPAQHVAIVFGDLAGGTDVPVRIHRESVLEDVFGTAPRLVDVMARFGSRGRGVLVYLREGAVGVAERTLEPGHAVAAPGAAGASAKRAKEWREIGLGAQILRDLGVRSIRLLAASDRRFVGLEGFGITVVDTERL